MRADDAGHGAGPGPGTIAIRPVPVDGYTLTVPDGDDSGSVTRIAVDRYRESDGPALELAGLRVARATRDGYLLVVSGRVRLLTGSPCGVAGQARPASG